MLIARDIFVSFDEKKVLRGVDLTVQTGEIMCLLGASGCGKTTLLRVIAGLQEEFQGEVAIDGESIVNVPIHERDFGLMFQDFALFPHMNVVNNVAFGLKMRNMTKTQQLQRAKEVISLVGLAGFEDRDVSSLSGGERQRVALARSLAPNPRLLMLDEPLGSLDASLRERLAVDLRKIIKQVGLTAIYVTHDQQEAFAVADQVALMDAGEIRQVATPQETYLHPESVFAARFLNLNNVYPVHGWQNGYCETEIGSFPCDNAKFILIHPENIHVGEAENSFLHVTIVERQFRGAIYELLAVTKDGIHIEFVMPSAESSKVPEVGEQVYLQTEADKAVGLSEE